MAPTTKPQESEEFCIMTTQDELVVELMQRLAAPQHRYTELDRYYQGKQPLAFLSPEARTALGNRFGVMASLSP